MTSEQLTFGETPKKAWKDETFIGFDTETSGRFPLVAEVVELAAVKWRGGKIIETFETFIRPTRPQDAKAISIHKITDEMVAQAPLMKDVLPRFLEFIGPDSILVAHNAPFDMGFLALEFEKYGIPLPSNKVICTSLLSLKTHPDLTSHRLVYLVSHFGIQVANFHRALEDSRACMEVAVKLMQALGETVSTDFILQTQGGALEWPKFSVSDLEANAVLSPLVEASRKQLVVDLTYSGGANPGQPRRITPHGIVRNPKGDYVVGLEHKENIEKRYYLNRVLEVKILD